MRPADRLTRVLASYGRFHRDPRNRRTHYFGVPAIVYAVLVPLALAVPTVFGIPIRLDRLVVAAAALGYLCFDVRLGLALGAVLALLAAAAEATGTLGSSATLGVAATIFVLGWALQLLGHRLEGNRPALLTNLAQTLSAPVFLIAELGFALGCRKELQRAMERQLGHTP